MSTSDVYTGDIPIDPTVAGGSNSIKVVGYDSSGNPSTAKFRTIIAGTAPSTDKAAPVITLLSPVEVLPKEPARGIVMANATSVPTAYAGAIPCVTVYLNWSDIQSASGAALSGPGMTALNAAISWAQANNGRVKIRLFCNGSYVSGARDSGAPAWLKTLVGTFRHLNSQDQNPSTDPALVLARYWRPGAISAYEGLISQLAAYVEPIAVVRDVTVSGAMMLYAEPFILDLADAPNRAELVGGGTGWAASGAAGIGGTNIAVPGAGFTDAAHMSAIKQCIDIHAKYFQNTPSSVCFNPYQILLSQSEAAAQGKTNTYTNDDQFFDSTDLTGIPNTKAMIDYAVASLGDRCVLENHSARPDYFTYDGSGNAATIDASQVYGQMFVYMVGKNGPILIQTANSTQIVSSTYPDVGVAFAKTMDAVINLLTAAGSEPPTDFQAQYAAGKTQFSPASMQAYTTALRTNPTHRGVINTANVTIAATGGSASYTIVATVQDPDSGVASVTINGVAVSADPTTGRYSLTLTGIGVGSHSYDVIATDNAGNQSRATATIIVTGTAVDVTPPALTAALIPAGGGADVAGDVTYPVGTTTVTVRGNAADESGGSGLASVKVNGVSVSVAADGSYSKAVATVAGSNPIKVVAVDNAGNSRSVTRTAQVTNHVAPKLAMTSPVGDETVANSQTTEGITGSVVLGDGTLTSVKVNGVTVASGGSAAYAGRWGADYGGGFMPVMMLDDRVDGHGVGIGDLWGFHVMTDWGDWSPRQHGTTVASGGNNGDYGRAGCAASAKYPGRYYIGVGGLNKTGLGGGYFGYVTDDITQTRHVSAASQYGFATAKSTDPGYVSPGIVAANRPRGGCGQLICIDYDSGSNTEYIYAAMTRAGGSVIARSTDGGETWTELWSGVITNGAWKGMELLDLNSDGVKDAIIFTTYRTANESGSVVRRLSAGSGSIRTATGQAQLTVQTIGAAPAVVEDIKDCSLARDGSVIRAACGSFGVWTVSRDGLTWTLQSGTQLNGVHVASIDGVAANDLSVGIAGVGALPSSPDAAFNYNGTTWTSVTTSTITHGSSGGHICTVPWNATAEYWLLAAGTTGAFTNYLGGTTFDVQYIMRSRRNTNIIALCGNAGGWLSKDKGATWRPFKGLNGGIIANILAGPTTGLVQNNDFDYAKTSGVVKSTDHSQSAVRLSGVAWPNWPPAGIRVLTDNAGNTYRITLGATPDITRTPAGGGTAVSIIDNFARAALISFNAWDNDDTTIYIAQWAGGVIVLEPGGTGFSTTMNLSVGTNNLAVVVTDSNGLTTEFDAVIIRAPAVTDTNAPTVSYDSPIDPTSLSTTVPYGSTSFVLSGHASDDSGTVSTLTVGGTVTTIASDGSWSRTITGLAVGNNVIAVTAVDPSGNTYSRTVTITRLASANPPNVQITTTDPTTVASGVTSVAIAGVASAPAGTVTGVDAWVGANAHTHATLGAAVAPQALAGAYLGDQSSLAGTQSYPGGMTGFGSAVGRPLGIQAYYATWDFASSVATAISTDIAAGRAAQLEWDAPPATSLSPMQQIANGSQDAIITAKINMLKPLGGLIYLRPFSNQLAPFDTGGLGTTAEFIAAWQHLHAMFAAAAVTNVKLVWCAGARRLRNGASQAYWPGDTNVDLIGIAITNTVVIGYEDVSLNADPVAAFSTAHSNLPVIICEAGSEEFAVASGTGSKAAWIAELDAWVAAHPIVKAWVWLQAIMVNASGVANDFRADSSSSALSAYQNAIRNPAYVPGVAWTATVPNLVPGNNTVQAQTTDSNGVVSSIDTITVVRSLVAGVPAATAPAPIITDSTQANRWQTGDVLHVTAGGFTNGPITAYDYRWYQDNNATPFAHTGPTAATSDNYSSRAGVDNGHTIRVEITATNANGSSAPVSTAASGVLHDPVPPPSVPSIQTNVSIQDIG